MKKIIAVLLLISFIWGIESTQETPQPLILAQKKSGFVLGVEALFGNFKIDEEKQQQSASIFTLMGRFFGGYQHYFDDNFGLKALLSIQDGTPITSNFHINQQQAQSFALPFWIGTELSFLWDFWQNEEHTLGLDAGLGYNFEIYHSREMKIGNTLHSLPQLYQHNLYPILGLHYYYNHHQFNLNYRFIGSLNSTLKSYQVTGIDFRTKYTLRDYLNLSYSYRF